MEESSQLSVIINTSGYRRRAATMRPFCQITLTITVVKANSQSNGNWQISTPRGSEIPERISMKLGIYNYVGGVTTHAHPYGAVATWVVSANTWLVTYFGFLVYFFLFLTLYLRSRRARTVGPILTVYTSYQIKSNQIYLPTQNMNEKNRQKTRSKAKCEKQWQTRVLVDGMKSFLVDGMATSESRQV